MIKPKESSNRNTISVFRVLCFAVFVFLLIVLGLHLFSRSDCRIAGTERFSSFTRVVGVREVSTSRNSNASNRMFCQAVYFSDTPTADKQQYVEYLISVGFEHFMSTLDRIHGWNSLNYYLVRDSHRGEFVTVVRIVAQESNNPPFNTVLVEIWRNSGWRDAAIYRFHQAALESLEWRDDGYFSIDLHVEYSHYWG